MKLQTTLLLLGFVLQALLLTLLFARRAARYVPIFTTLIAFYLLRSVFLYGFFGRIDSDAYELWLNALDLFDLLLQVLVTWELFHKTRTFSSVPNLINAPDRRRSERLRDTALFAGLLFVASLAAWAISWIVPASPHYPADRGILFTSMLMLLAGLLSMTKMTSLAQRLLFGFGALGVVNIVCQIERTLAAFHRAALAFRRWSYIEVLGYLVVVLFWIAISADSRFRPRAPRSSGEELTLPSAGSGSPGSARVLSNCD